jgi:hypothetical protein
LPDQGHQIHLNAEISIVEDRCEAICRGPFQRADVIHLIDFLHEKINGHPELKKCLLDIRNAEIALGIMGEFIIGEYAAKRLSGLRIALIQAAGQVKKLLEDTAYNRGLRILIVEGRQDALAWLDK